MSNLLIANQKKFWSTGQLVPVSCVMDVKILLFISTYLVVKSKQLPCSLQPGEIYVTGNSLECYTLTYEWEKGENYTVAEKQVFVSEPEMISKVCESEANICMSMAGSDGVQPCVKVQLYSLYREDDEGLRHERQRGEDPHWLQPHHEGEVRLAGRP